MRLTVGTPASHTDFFPREPETEALWHLAERGHALVLAPRPVGKTSLLRHFEHNPRRGWHCLYLSVEGARTEQEFVSRLATLLYRPQKDEVWNSSFGKRLKNLIPGVLLNAEPFQGALASAVEANWKEVGLAALEGLEEAHGNNLIMIDEFPLFVRKLLEPSASQRDRDEAQLRTRVFLDWFREIRAALAEKGGKVHFVLTGSVGLDSVVEAVGMTSTINDLSAFHLGPLSPESADRMLIRLSKGENLPLSKAARERFLFHLDWLIPFHLQLLFLAVHRMARGKDQPAAPALVDQAADSLLSHENRLYFRHWAERLQDYHLAPNEADLKKALLDVASTDENGIDRDAIIQIHQATSPEVSVEAVLASLEHDAYLIYWEDRWRFASSLLRKWWQRYQVKRRF